jgi:hypothetical protein
MRIIIENGQLVSVDGRRILGKCNRCGVCCSVYENGLPCRHMKVETWDGTRTVVSCNPDTLKGGYWGRFIGCIVYPTPDNILPTCGFRYE